MKKNPGRILIALTAVALIIAVNGCSDDDDGLTLTAEINAETVTEGLQLVQTTIPECVSNVPAAKSDARSSNQGGNGPIAVALAPLLSPKAGIGPIVEGQVRTVRTATMTPMDHGLFVGNSRIVDPDLDGTGASPFDPGGRCRALKVAGSVERNGLPAKHILHHRAAVGREVPQ